MTEKQRLLSETIFGLMLSGKLDPKEMEPELLTAPYDNATRDIELGRVGLMAKYGFDAIIAADEAAKRVNGSAGKEWIDELRKASAEGQLATLLERTTKLLESGDEIDWLRVEDEIRQRQDTATIPMPWVLSDFLGHEWLWDGWIPASEVSILVGHPGVGKSSLALYFAGCVANGSPLPDGHTSQLHGKVLWVETEGRMMENFHRAKMWRMDVSNFLVPFKDSRRVMDFSSPEDFSILRSILKNEDIALCIVDSLGGAMAQENEGSAKVVVQRLATMAQETSTTMIVIHHLRKDQKSDKGSNITLAQVRGHSGIPQFSPAVLAVDSYGQEMDRLIYPIKMNFAPIGGSYTFRLSETGITWPDTPTQRQDRDRKREIGLWLSERIGNEKIPLPAIMDEGLALGHSYDRIKSVALNLGFRMIRDEEGEICWSK